MAKPEADEIPDADLALESWPCENEGEPLPSCVIGFAPTSIRIECAYCRRVIRDGDRPAMFDICDGCGGVA